MKFVIIFAFYLLGASLSSPYVPKAVKISNYSNHKNFNLLSPRGVCGIGPLADKVYGGNVSSIDEYPWMVRLRYKLNKIDTGYQCSGVLINERYVLTAAHCLIGKVKRIFGDVVQARFGEHDSRTDPDFEIDDEGGKIWADPVVDKEIEEVIPYPNYDQIQKHHDIGLIRLKENIVFTSYIKSICLPLNGERSNPGVKLTAAGWGKTETTDTSPVKMKVNLPIMSQQQCSRIYAGANRQIIDNQLCAGGIKGTDACNGDSGGPLMTYFPDESTDFYIEGIVSFGLTECGTKGVPGIYTRVSEYVGWILDNIKS